jgi:hypothetical protein
MRILFSVLIAVVLGGFSVAYNFFDEPRVLRSVEIGLAEFSPRGLAGGVAVPASGDSVLPPLANIYVRSNGDAWTGANISIYLGADLDIRWNSVNATQCTGSAFTVTPAGAIGGVQTNVVSPGANVTITYTVTCTNSAGTATDSLTVTARSTPAPQCDDNIDNADPEDTFIDFDGGSTAVGATTCWVKGTGSCSVVCAGASGTSAGGQCVSGESRTSESVNQLLSAGAFIYGCWADRTCNSGFHGSGTQIGQNVLINNPYYHDGEYRPEYATIQMCYAPGQRQDSDGTDRSVGCNCNVPDASLCTTPPTPVYGTPDPGCTSPTDTDETDGPPTVDLRVKNDNTTMSYTGNNISIPTGNNISLRWTSSNATQCVGTAFSISPATLTTGTQSTVTEPTQGNTTRYSVRCTGPRGAATDFLDVTAVAAVGQPPTITADPRIVRYGEDTTLTWNTGTSDPAECSASGAGFLMSQLSSQSGTTRPTITAETVFTLSCPLGSASVTVKVLPQVQES